jgi:protein-tyrosine phosphatase
MTFNGYLPHRRMAIVLCFFLIASVASAASPKGTQKPAVSFETVAVDSTDGRVFTLSWHAPGTHHVTVYAGTDPLHIGRKNKVAAGSGDGRVTIADLPLADRWYFQLVPDQGRPLVVADRALHLGTAPNFRDIGGYRTTEGKWVRMGLAYRSNGLEHLTQAELNSIGALGLRLVCDLRTDDERQHGPDRVPSAVQVIAADVMADDPDPTARILAALAKSQDGQPSVDPAALLQPIYRGFVNSGSARKGYHLLFERLADRRSLPMLFHCTAGKDRSGWAAAVLLTILGVPHATVVADYQLTDHYLDAAAAETIRRMRFPSVDAAIWRRILAADPSYLEAAFDETVKAYGSFAGYLHQGLGLDDATLDAIRRNFLVD